MSLKKKGRFTGILFFVAMIVCVVYFSFFSNAEADNKIKLIVLTGNNYLSREQYFKFSKLNNISDYKFLTLAIIKDRLEKHPYIQRADVRYNGNKEVLIEIVEKKFKACVLREDQEYLVSEDFHYSPAMPFTRNINLPIISNPMMGRVKERNGLLKNAEIIIAFKIIDAAKLMNNDMYAGISEINMRNGHDIILTLSGHEFPIVLGRGSEAKKMVYLNSIWGKISNDKEAMDDFISYIDLRFEKLVYVGMTDTNNEVVVEAGEEGNKG